MTLFFIVAAVLVLLALILMLPAIIGDRADGRAEQLGANVSIARERQVQLDNALATSAIDEETHQREAAAIELELARELASQPEGEPANASGGGRLLQWGTAIVLALFVPLASALLYINLGDPGAIDRDRSPSTQGLLRWPISCPIWKQGLLRIRKMSWAGVCWAAPT